MGVKSVLDVFSPSIPKAAKVPSVNDAQAAEAAAAEEASRKAKAALVAGRQTLLTSGTGSLAGVSTQSPTLLGG